MKIKKAMQLLFQNYIAHTVLFINELLKNIYIYILHIIIVGATFKNTAADLKYTIKNNIIINRLYSKILVVLVDFSLT